MTTLFQRELEKLRTRIIKMGSLVDEQVETAFRAMTEWNPELAQQVCDRDSKVDKVYYKILKQCQRIVALQQPVAKDLRMVIAAMKINSDMERMGDLASNVARSIETLMPFRGEVDALEVSAMFDAVQKMVRHTVDSFINIDPELALAVLKSDVRVDQFEQRIGRQVIERMKANPDFIEAGATLIVQLRHLERLADHATNVAEDIIFFAEARVIRNRFDSEAFEELQKDLQSDDDD